MPGRHNNTKTRSQSQSANSPPVFVEGGDGVDGRQLLQEITQQYNRNYVEQPGFQDRILMNHYAVATAPDMPRYIPNPTARYSSSLAPAYTASLSSSRNTPSQYAVQYPTSHYSISSRYSRTPSLTTQATIATGSDGSWERRAESIAKTGPIDEDGILQSSDMPCDFGFMRCTKSFPIGWQWHNHSRTHFRSCPPPTEVSCPAVGCGWYRTYPDGEEAWKKRSKHIEDKHSSRQDWDQGWKRPDKILIQHLYKNRLVHPEQFRDLVVSGRIESTPYTLTHGRRDDQRREPGYQGRRQNYPHG